MRNLGKSRRNMRRRISLATRFSLLPISWDKTYKIEVSVPLSTLGINNTATIGVGYMQDNSTTNRLPAQSASLPTKVLLH